MTRDIDDTASEARRASANETHGQYIACVEIRNAELAAHWSRFNFQFAVNFGLLLAVVIRARDPFVAAHLHVITIIGAELALIWLLLSVQSKKAVNTWESRLRSYEDTMGRDDRLFQKITEQETAKSWWRKNWQNLNLFTLALPTLCFLAWCLLFATKKLD